MITRLHLQNFKCLLDVEVELAPFTILIGPNDSGKSSLLDAIHLLSRTAREPLNQVFSGDASFGNLVSWKDPNREIVWQVKGDTSGGSFDYRLELSSAKQQPSAEELSVNGNLVLRLEGNTRGDRCVILPGDKNQRVSLSLVGTGLLSASGSRPNLHSLGAVAEALASTTKYRLDPDELRTPTTIQENPVLAPSGSNLVSVLESIVTGPDPSNRIRLEDELHQAIPTLRGITLPTVGGKKSLSFTLARNGQASVPIPSTLASDGAMLLTAFLALAYGNTPEILLVEEPENGLHPSRLKMVIDLLQKMSTGKVGNRPRQVIVTTHSPILLNFAQAEQVRIFRRTPEGGTQVMPMTEVPGIERLLKEFAAGELWYLLGEEGLVKGQPA